jgi:RecA-family ATPase
MNAYTPQESLNPAELRGEVSDEQLLGPLTSSKVDTSRFPPGYIERMIEEASYTSYSGATGANRLAVAAPTSTNNGIYTLGELLDRPASEVPLLIAPFLQQQGVAMLAGSSDTGKSSFLRQLALAVVLENPTFLGFPIHALHHSAICVSTEDGDDAIAPLLKKQLSGQTIPNGACDRLRFVFNTDFLPMTLDKLLTQRPADVVIVDALGDLFEGNLNQSNEVRRFVATYSALAKKHKCLVLFMHHTGKRTEEQKPSKNNLLGSQGIEAKMRVVLELRLDRRNSQLRHLCILKGNYLPQELKNSSYVLHFDENLVFHNTNERRSFNELLKRPDENTSRSNEDALWEQARQYLDEGHSFERTAAMLVPLAEELRLKPLSKSAIGRRFHKGDAQQPIVPSS